jgi:hypothetical protein
MQPAPNVQVHHGCGSLYHRGSVPAGRERPVVHRSVVTAREAVRRAEVGGGRRTLAKERVVRRSCDKAATADQRDYEEPSGVDKAIKNLKSARRELREEFHRQRVELNRVKTDGGDVDETLSKLATIQSVIDRLRYDIEILSELQKERA